MLPTLPTTVIDLFTFLGESDPLADRLVGKNTLPKNKLQKRPLNETWPDEDRSPRSHNVPRTRSPVPLMEDALKEVRQTCAAPLELRFTVLSTAVSGTPSSSVTEVYLRWVMQSAKGTLSFNCIFNPPNPLPIRRVVPPHRWWVLVPTLPTIGSRQGASIALHPLITLRTGPLYPMNNRRFAPRS